MFCYCFTTIKSMGCMIYDLGTLPLLGNSLVVTHKHLPSRHRIKDMYSIQPLPLHTWPLSSQRKPKGPSVGLEIFELAKEEELLAKEVLRAKIWTLLPEMNGMALRQPAKPRLQTTSPLGIVTKVSFLKPCSGVEIAFNVLWPYYCCFCSANGLP